MQIISEPDINDGEPTLAGTTVIVAEIVTKRIRRRHGRWRRAGRPAGSAVVLETRDRLLRRPRLRSGDTLLHRLPVALRCRRASLHHRRLPGQFERVTLRRSRGLEMRGRGACRRAIEPSLDALSKSWRGKELFYFARRDRPPQQARDRATAEADDRRPRRRPGAEHDPGASAARRQHRHGRAGDGQLRPRRTAPRRAARRLAERQGAGGRVRRRFHRRSGAKPIRRLPTGDRRPQFRLRHDGPPARPDEAGADARAGGGRDPAPTGAGPALRRAVRPGAHRPRNRRDRRSPTPW